MAKKNYDELSNRIIDLIGGKENIGFFTHCMTRLRFNIKDKGLVKTEKIETIPGVLGLQWAGEQLQIIIGPSVDNVYKKICKDNGMEILDKLNLNYS